jgi:hypothetical protein
MPNTNSREDRAERWIDRHDKKLLLVRTLVAVLTCVLSLLTCLKVFNIL